jgi:DNA-damage-inducible protein J
MSKTTALTIEIDVDLKKKTERLLRDMGLTPSQAITLFYKQIESKHALPFDANLNEPNEETLQAIEDSIQGRMIKAKNVDDMFADLLKK